MSKLTEKKENSIITYTQENIPDLIEKVNQELKKVKANSSDRKKITDELEYFGRIDKINKVGTLIKAHSSLVNRKKAYMESAAVLLKDYKKLKTPAFIVNGHSVEAWVEEIQERINYLVHEKRIQALQKSKTELEKHLSEEMKLQKTLSSIQDTLLSNEIE